MSTEIPGPPPPALPAGWYNDGSGRERYWDGYGWSGQAEALPGFPATLTPPPQRRIWPRVLTGSLAVAVLLIGGAVLITQVNQAAQASVAKDAAEEAVRGLNNAVSHKDCDAMFATTTARLRTELNVATCAYFTGYVTSTITPRDLYDLSIDDVTVAAGLQRAVVETTQTAYLAGGVQGPAGTYELVNEDGAWLVDYIPTGGPFVGSINFGVW